MEVPKTTASRTLVGLMGILWIGEWLLKGGLTRRYTLVGYLTRLGNWIPAHPTVRDIAQKSSFRPESANLTLVGTGEDDADPDSYQQGVDMSSVEESFDKLISRIPDMSQGFFRGGWSGLFTVTPDKITLPASFTPPSFKSR